MLEQGLCLPDLVLTSVSPLPPPAPATLPDLTTRPSCSHTVSTPPNTAGSVKPKMRKLVPASTQPVPILPATARPKLHSSPSPRASTSSPSPQPSTYPSSPAETPSSPGPPIQPVIHLMVNPASASHAFGPTTSSTQPLPQVHYQTPRYQRIKAQEQAEGKTRRTYTKTKMDRTCKKCGQVIDNTTHKNLVGALYCP